MKNVVIIGGGACGSAALIELLIQSIAKKFEKQISFTLIERSDRVGYGLAFGTEQKSHLLNTQADLMGIYAHEPGHFAAWLREHGGQRRNDVKGDSNEENAYTSRILYGHYVSQELEKTIEKAQQHGISVAIIHSEAITIDRLENEQLSVALTNGSCVVADEVLLAPGTPKPNSFKELREYKQYIDFPWPSERLLEGTGQADHVGILGTSLSAIDTVLTLIDNGHTGMITMFSPDGMLPRVQPDENKELDRSYLTLENLHKLQRQYGHQPTVKELFRLFIKDVEAAEGKKPDWSAMNRYGKDPLPLLEQDIRIAEKGGDSVLNMAYALRYDTSAIWSWMDMEQQLMFNTWLGRYWTINRHAIPLYNAKRIAKLIRQGKLEVIAENKKVAFDEKKKQFRISTSKNGIHYTDRLVNATGSAGKLEKMDNILLENLLHKKYLQPHPLGGAVINPHTMQCVSEKGGEHIYGVGHLVNGMLMDVNAVWFNVKTTARLAGELIFKITGDGRI
ncbi:FAD/NAD(P)-binding protein [Sinomicrobium sp. M5D2P17]